MLYKSIQAAVLLGAVSLTNAQTFTKCDPTKKTCPPNPALGKSITTDFTTGESDDWGALAGTTMQYNKATAGNGAEFVIKKSTDAPTMQYSKYIFFGEVSAVMLASAGSGIVSSFILESDDLDEIDWEWIGTAGKEVQSNFFGKGDVSTYDRGATHQLTGADGKAVDSTAQYLKYSIEWTAESIKWKIGPEDGTADQQKVVRQLFYTDPLAKQGTRYPQTPMKIKMGSWIACLDKNDPAKKGTCDWAGGEYQPGSDYVMSVKSVTISDYGCGGDGEYTYGDLTGSWQSIKPAGVCAGPAKNSEASSDSKDSSETKSSTTKGAVFVESSTSAAGTSATDAPSSEKTTSSGTAKSASTTSTVSAPTTLLSATTSGSSTQAPTTGTTSSSSSSPTESTNAAVKPKHPLLGNVEYSVMGLGLVFGYFFM